MQPKIRKYIIGSQRGGRTLQGMREYHKAKRAGKTAIIVARNEMEKLRLCRDFGVLPGDVYVHGPERIPGKSDQFDILYKPWSEIY